MNKSSAAAVVTLREGSANDLDDVTSLLSLRDGKQRDPDVVSDYLWGLQPDRVRVWLAHVDGQPAGITALYLRTMNWPESGVVDNPPESLVAGYWAHLYVRPEFRAKMLYPQLVFAMLRGMAAAGIAVIYTATRQPAVAEAHQKLGFALAGSIPLKLQPLRPFCLLAKQRRLPWLARFSAPLDAAYWLLARPRSAVGLVETVDLQSHFVEQIAEWLNQRDSRRVRQIWTADQLRRRYRTTLDGSEYRITATRRNDRMTAALITTLAERGNGIRAAVLLELAAAPDATAADVRALLSEAHQFARLQAAEVMLSLPETLMLPLSSRPASRYITSGSEQYHLLAYPKSMAQPPQPSAAVEGWQFSFGDHDAF